jgi:hypothetical protein
VPAVGVAFAASHWTTWAAQAVTISACLIGGAFAGWLLYVAVERPITITLNKRAAA